MDGAVTTGIPPISADTLRGQKENPFLTRVYTLTNTCKSPSLSRLPPPNAANRVVFMAGLSGCVSMLHHISRDRERRRKGRERDSLSHARLHGSASPACQSGSTRHVKHNASLCALSSCYYIICREKRGCSLRVMNH